MKTRLTLFIAVVFLLIISFFVGKCSKEQSVLVTKVTVEAISGSSDTLTNLKPIPTQIKDSIRYKDSIIVHDKQFDKEMVDKFNSLTNEYERLKAYISAVETNVYSIPIENEYLITTNNFTVQGKLIDFQQDFKIKERTIVIETPKEKQSVFAVYAGLGLETTTTLEHFEPSANLLFQNKKGDIFGLEVGLDESIQFSFSKKLFEIKR